MTAHISVFRKSSRPACQGYRKQNLLPHTSGSPKNLPRLPPFFIPDANSHEATAASRDKYSENVFVQMIYPVISPCPEAKFFRKITQTEKRFYYSTYI
ncbi:hypothetical protein [Gluconobacter aidae]|uniref:Uncharacterized protein n=1 Tax=Gluconobacter aidae TaxID=2662454 RepID=A0A7X1VNP1_9PROT|nr:hypothetical protein [Gluconobacter aidae]MQS00004.1 hypothetical protein [Gluconobacter aidae]